MPNLKQSAARRASMVERALQMMDIHFPEYNKTLLWDRKVNHGFTTIPRTLPIVMQIIDQLTKGHAAGHTLFCLWSRMPDHYLLVIENTTTFAAEAGFTGNRKVDTWRRRMKLLKSLGFIDSKNGASGEFHYVLLLNPNVAIEKLYRAGQVQSEIYSRLRDRLAEIGGMKEIENWQNAEAERT